MVCVRLVALILCAGFASVAWGQQPAGTCINNWTEVHRTNMERWNPCEKVLSVNNVGNLGLKCSYATIGGVYSSPAVVNRAVYVGSESYAGQVYALNASTGSQAVELYHRRPRVFLTCRGEWSGLCRLDEQLHTR